MTTPPPPDHDDTTRPIAALAARHGLDVHVEDMRIEESGLDYRVAFARASDGRSCRRLSSGPDDFASKRDYLGSLEPPRSRVTRPSARG